MKDHELIAELKADLAPIRSPVQPSLVVCAWFALSLVYVTVLSVLLGPYRPGFAAQLLGVPQFSLEMLLGAAAMASFAVLAIAESLPGIDVRWLRRVGWVLGLGWLSQFLLGFEFPALAPSMLGKREYCAWEAYLYSVPPLLGMIWLQRRRYVLRPVRAVLYGAIAAGTIPALMMQIACMYEPTHGLLFHVLPVAILAASASAVAWFVGAMRGR